MDAKRSTDDFYQKGGFGYELPNVVKLLKRYIDFPLAGKVLDICCGDGVWLKGMKQMNPAIDVWGVDISEGGIEQAKEVGGTFQIADAENPLPVPLGYFDLVFTRGPMIFNQHDMSRKETVELIEDWHKHLKKEGRFLSVYYANPKFMGEYSQNVSLPMNMQPRKTRTVDFSGGKYHHTEESFLKPFKMARNVEISAYRFLGNEHILTTHLK